MQVKLLITIIKYASVLAVISFIAFSIWSSYTLREEIGSLKQQLKQSEQSQQQILDSVKENRERLMELRENRIIVVNTIEELKRVEDEEFFEELYNHLYNRPIRLSNPNNR